ncbi:MAG: rhomboid family intramembrane serine protease [Actinomycetes bacterium]
MTDQADQPDHGVAGPPEAQTCYRHPEREAHIRCTRCDRRICPDCMVSAAVGFQCPECVREANKGVREARTQFGGRVTGGAGVVTKALIVINVVVLLLTMASTQLRDHLELIGLARDASTFQLVGVADGEYWRLLTAAFLHAGFLHLALNMYALYLFGPPLEAALGRVRFLALYIIAALGGNALSYAFSAPNQPSVGASGAVFGLLGAFLVVNRKLGRDTSGLLVLVAINFAFGFIAPNIDWRAHLGGLIAGALVGMAFVHAPPARRTLTQTTGAVVVLLGIAALVAWRTASLT